MDNAKTSLSGADSYEGIGEFWDAHDLDEFWDATRAAEFEIVSDEQHSYLPIPTDLMPSLRAMAQRQNVSPASLLSQWLRERLSCDGA